MIATYPLNLEKYNFLSKTSITSLLGFRNKVQHSPSSKLLLLTLHWTSRSQNTAVYAYQKFLKFRWQIAPMWMVLDVMLALPIPESPPTVSAIWVPASYLLSLAIVFLFFSSTPWNSCAFLSKTVSLSLLWLSFCWPTPSVPHLSAVLLRRFPISRLISAQERFSCPLLRSFFYLL